MCLKEMSEGRQERWELIRIVGLSDGGESEGLW